MTINSLNQKSSEATSTSIDRHLHRFSAADKATTLELFQKYRQNPSPVLRDRLVRLNIGLVKKEVSLWSDRHSELYEDLLQVGALGLIAAIDRFQIQRGYAFSSFAVRYIRGEIQHYLRDKSTSVRIPRRWMEIQQQSVQVMQNLRNTLQREPSNKEIASALGISLSEWQETQLACQNRAPLSLDAPTASEDNDGGSFGDLVADPKSNRQLQDDQWTLQQAMANLEQQTRKIVEFVFIEDMPQKDVAQMLGLSAVAVSRQIKKGLLLLRGVLEAEAC